MAIAGNKYEDPRNERWALAVEKALKEALVKIETLERKVINLEGRTR